MTLPIITAEQRMAEKKGIKGCIFGKSGIGKTSLLWTLNPEKTLFMDLESGDLAVQGWEGNTIRPKNWQECIDFAVFIGGPNKSKRNDQPYSQAHYDHVCEQYGDPSILDQFDTIFVDSITVAGRLSFAHAQGQPDAFNKDGQPDTRGAYGLHGREMLAWITQLQHTRAKNVWFLGILDEKKDEAGRISFTPQIEGSKAGLELPGIVDQVVTMTEMHTNEGQPYRAFVCQTMNPLRFPAKDRSGRLDLYEEPHLGKLMEKISQPVRPASERLTYDTPENTTEE